MRKCFGQRMMFLLLMGVLLSLALLSFWREISDAADGKILDVLGFEEGAGINGSILYSKKDENTEDFMKKLLACSLDLEKLLGLPNHKIRIILDFQSSIPMNSGQIQRHWLLRNTRLLQLPVKSVSDGVIYHELVHCFYQSDSWLSRCPLLAVEGLAEAVACEVFGKYPDLLIPRYENYYLNHLHGLIHPDEKMPEELIMKNITFSVAALFFKKLHEIEPGIYVRILNHDLKRKQGWNQFLQEIIDESPERESLLNFITRCTVFSELKSRFYAIPIRSGLDKQISFILYVDDLKAVDRCSLPIQVMNGKDNSAETHLVTFYHGSGQVSVGHIKSDPMVFKLHHGGECLKAIFFLEGRTP